MRTSVNHVFLAHNLILLGRKTLRLKYLFIVLLSTNFLMLACDSSTESPDSESEAEQTVVEGTLDFANPQGESIRLEDPLRVEDSERARVSLSALWNEEIISDAEWSSGDENIATITVEEDGLALVEAKGAGETDISISYLGNDLSMTIQVIAQTALKVTGPERQLKPSDSFNLGVKLQWSDNSTESIESPDEITWTSATEAAAVSENGEVTILSFGTVEIKAELTTDSGETLSGSWEVEVPCTYPEPSGRSFNTDLELGTVLPPVKWERAYSAMDGSISSLSMEDVYCSDEYNWVKTINFLISAGWCTACPSHLRAVRDMSDELREAGGLLVYIEVQDDDGEPADSDFAWGELSDLLGPTNGYFVGDKETQPLTRFFGRSPTIQAFPDAYVVRRSDMHILTSLELNRSVGVLPLVRIAEQPDEDWTTIMPPPFESSCVEGDDELSEPNDTPAEAGLIEPGTHQGAICSEAPDYYQIDVDGPWTFSVAFSHAEADLDIFQYAVGQSGGDPVNVSNGTSDMESISGSGPAVIGVFSYTRTSASYTITLQTP